MGQIAKGLDYVKSIPFVLKICETVVLLIAFSLVGHFQNKAPDGFFDAYGRKGNLEFFLFAAIVGWIIAIAFLIIFVVGIHEKIPALSWTLVVAIVSGVWTLLLLISSALLASAVNHYDGLDIVVGIFFNNKTTTLCKRLDDINADAQCGHLIGGAVCGFIGTILYAVDAAIHAKMFCTGRSSAQASGAPKA